MDFRYTTIDTLLEKELGKQIQTLDLFSRERRCASRGRERDVFARICRQLTSQLQFKPILDFVFEAFHVHEDIDMMLLKELLSQVNIERNGSAPYTLADLSRDYLLELHPYMASYWHDRKVDFTGVDLFEACACLVFWKHGLPPKYERIINKVLLRNIYTDGVEEFCEEAGDFIVNTVRRQAERAYQEECEEIDAWNAEYSAYEWLGKKSHPEFTVFDRDREIPGILMPFFWEAALQSDTVDQCHFILEKYVLPVLEATPWEQEENPKVSQIVKTAGAYAEYLWGLLNTALGSKINDTYSPRDEDYVEDILYYEALGWEKKDKYQYADSKAAEYAHRHGEAFRQWANILHRGGSMLKQAIHPQSYSFLMLSIPFMLYLSGQIEDACRFLQQHYADIGNYEKRKPYFHILLTRCILAAPRLAAVNALYGIFTNEMDRVCRDRTQILDLTRQMVRFLQDARSYILESKKADPKEKVTVFELLFSDGRIDSLLEQCEDALLEDDIPDYGLFRKLATCVAAFSDRRGIHLGYLGLGRYDGYDKLEDALSEQLRLRGEGYRKQIDDAKVFYAQHDTLHSIDLRLQNHATRLQMDGVKGKLEQVKRLKEQKLAKLKEQKLTEEMKEKAHEELLREIEDITKEVVDIAKGAYLWRPEVEHDIHRLRQEFERTYANELDGDKDLMGKLSKKDRDGVHNYLVTSNMVFRMMENQNDSKLDYSAALISMTKALELVMLRIYWKVNVKKYSGLKYDEKFYFEKDGTVKRENQTLQACIEVLKDEERIEIWGVDKVLDLSLLEKFDEIKELDTNKLKGLKPKYYKAYQDTAKGDRMVCVSKLRLALTYVCQKYRNATAHSQFIELDRVKECREMLLMGERLLWILLAIMR